jgi:Fe-Mn family superoxide dismutase
MNKREFISTTAAIGLASMMPLFSQTNNKFNIYDLNNTVNQSGEYQLPKLDYSYDALEPYFDAQTMELHHSKHHLAYVNGLNTAHKKIKESIETGDFSTIKHWERELAFHGGGHFLHSIFWKVLSKKQTKPSKNLEKYINNSFGSLDNFKKLFKAASNSVEGSGWGIMHYEPFSDRLIIMQAERQGNLTQWVTIPILPLDVWEHAYYLKYQNRRADYIDAFFNIINWDYVSDQFENILKLYK